MTRALSLQLCCAFAATAASSAAPVLVNNSAPRTTLGGEIVDSHNGGLVIFSGGRYLLFGVGYGGCAEQRDGCSNSSAGACGFGDNATVSVYSSPDLSQSSWSLERADVLPTPPGQQRGTVSRPSLVFCPHTGLWLLFWNFANATDGGGGQFSLAVASAGDPLGPFSLVAAPIDMPHAFIGDFTVFVDEAENATAWVYYTTWDENVLGQLFLARLDNSFTRLAAPLESIGPLFSGLGLMESPQMWRRDGGDYYFLAGHGCCFCFEGSDLFVFTAPSVRGPYTARGASGCDYTLPAPHVSVASHGCLRDGVCYTSTLQAEFAYAFAVGAQRVLVWDRWQHAPDGLKGHDGELWLPVEYAADGALLPVQPVATWTLDVPAPAAPPPCSMNGVLDAGGACVCDAGWRGADCSSLALLPAAPLNTQSQAYLNASDNSWGISILAQPIDGIFHGFMTELQNNCSLAEYGIASRILHVTSPAPEGPFSVADVALPAFAHNSQAVIDTDGASLLFHIGYSFPPGCDNVACPHGGGGGPVTNKSCSYPSAKGASVARSLSPSGPWERVPFILPDNQTNPSALVLPNGTIVVTARRWNGSVPVYVSTTGWRGPYLERAPADVVLVPPAPPPPTAPFDEDPFLYFDARGGWHMLTHRQPLGDYCAPTGPEASDCRCAGGHMYAESVDGPWYVDTRLVFNCSLAVAGDPAGVRLHARQRPTLLRREGQCDLLFTGASTDPVSQYYSSFSMVARVDCLPA